MRLYAYVPNLQSCFFQKGGEFLSSFGQDNQRLLDERWVALSFWDQELYTKGILTEVLEPIMGLALRLGIVKMARFPGHSFQA